MFRGVATLSDRLQSPVAHSATRLHSAHVSSTKSRLFALFWVTQELGGVRTGQDGDGLEPPNELQPSSSESCGWRHRLHVHILYSLWHIPQKMFLLEETFQQERSLRINQPHLTVNLQNSESRQVVFWLLLSRAQRQQAGWKVYLRERLFWSRGRSHDGAASRPDGIGFYPSCD